MLYMCTSLRTVPTNTCTFSFITWFLVLKWCKMLNVWSMHPTAYQLFIASLRYNYIVGFYKGKDYYMCLNIPDLNLHWQTDVLYILRSLFSWNYIFVWKTISTLIQSTSPKPFTEAIDWSLLTQCNQPKTI